MRLKMSIIIALFLCVFSACHSSDLPSESFDPMPSYMKDLWAQGGGLVFESESLGIIVEFPLEWTGLIRIYEYYETEENMRYEKDPVIRIEVIKGWDTAEEDSGHVGSIYKFPKSDWDNKTDKIPTGIYDCGSIHVMAGNEEEVIIIYVYGGLVGYETKTSPGFFEYKTIMNELNNGSYLAYFS